MRLDYTLNPLTQKQFVCWCFVASCRYEEFHTKVDPGKLSWNISSEKYYLLYSSGFEYPRSKISLNNNNNIYLYNV